MFSSKSYLEPLINRICRFVIGLELSTDGWAVLPPEGADEPAAPALNTTFGTGLKQIKYSSL